MNPEKLKKLQAAQNTVRAKGMPRRKKKVVHTSQGASDKKLQSSLKKLSVSTIIGIEEVNLIKDDGTVIHFDMPDVQASLSANTFAISGRSETRPIFEMMPDILNHLGPDSFNQLGNWIPEEDDEEVPDLVGNFDEASNSEVGMKIPEKVEVEKVPEVKEQPEETEEKVPEEKKQPEENEEKVPEEKKEPEEKEEKVPEEKKQLEENEGKKELEVD